MTTANPLHDALTAADPSEGTQWLKGLAAYNDAPDSTTKEDRYYLALNAADPSEGTQWHEGEKKLINLGELSKPKIVEETESVEEAHPVRTRFGFTIAGFFIGGVLGLALGYLVSWQIRDSVGHGDGIDVPVFWIILVASALIGAGLGFMIASIALDRRKTHKEKAPKKKVEIVSMSEFAASTPTQTTA